MLHNFYYNQKILPDSVILKHARCADVRFKQIIERVQAYINSFDPLITKQWNTLQIHNVNIERLVKFSGKLNELEN